MFGKKEKKFNDRDLTMNRGENDEFIQKMLNHGRERMRKGTSI